MDARGVYPARVPVLLGLLASLLWGTSDFLGGTLSRRLPVATVLLTSQLVALVALVPLALATGGFTVGTGYLLPGAAAGLIGLTALAAFFRALAAGTMGVVAPVAALGVAVPVLLGFANGESPRPAQLAGMVVAVAGVVVASGPELSAGPGQPGGRRVFLLAGVAAVGFGLVIALVAAGSRGHGAGVATVVMVLITMRVASVVVLGLRAAVGRFLRAARPANGPANGPDTGTGGGLRWGRSGWLGLVGVGLFDVGANGSFAVASQGALVSVVAVLASLYPVVTLLLARHVHHERLRRPQLAGVAGALAGVVLLSLG